MNETVTLTPEIARDLLLLAQASGASTWRKREPSAEMLKQFGSVRSFIEQPRQGTYAQEILAEDYEGSDELRKTHVDFITLFAHHAQQLLQAYLYAMYNDYCRKVSDAGVHRPALMTYSGWLHSIGFTTEQIYNMENL